MSAKQHRHSYNPFALRGLVRFLRGSWWMLIILCTVIALGLLWTIKALPPVPRNILIGQPILENPGAFDFEKCSLVVFPTHEALNNSVPLQFSPPVSPPVSVPLQFSPPARATLPSSLGFIYPAIDPNDEFCPIASYGKQAQPTLRFDILNLSNRQTIFLGEFDQGAVYRPLYRPGKHEFLIVNVGLEDTLKQRMAALNILSELSISKEITSRIHRFAADTGAYLGQLEVPLPLMPCDVSPDGRKLLGLAQAINPFDPGRLMVVDLESGQYEKMPLLCGRCYFESAQSILAFSARSITRIHLQDKRMEQLQTWPKDGKITIYNHLISPLQKGDNIFFTMHDFTVGSLPKGATRLRCGIISLDGKAKIQTWETLLHDNLSAIAKQSTFLPEREFAIGSKEDSTNANPYTFCLYNFKTGVIVKEFPKMSLAPAFLSKDYIFMRIGKSNHLVHIDQFLEGSLKLEQAEVDK